MYLNQNNTSISDPNFTDFQKEVILTICEIQKESLINLYGKGGETWEEFQEAANTTPEPELQQEVRARLVAEADAAKTAKAESKKVAVTPPDAELDEQGYAKEPRPKSELGALLAQDEMKKRRSL